MCKFSFFFFFFFFGSPTHLISTRGLDFLVLTEEIVTSENEVVFINKIKLQYNVLLPSLKYL